MIVGAKMFLENGTMTVCDTGGCIHGYIIWKRHTRIGCMRWTYRVTSCSPPPAKRTCTTRKVTLRTRASPDSPMHIS